MVITTPSHLYNGIVMVLLRYQDTKSYGKSVVPNVLLSYLQQGCQQATTLGPENWVTVPDSCRELLLCAWNLKWSGPEFRLLPENGIPVTNSTSNSTLTSTTINFYNYCKSGNFRAFRSKMVRRENKTARILCQNACLRVQASCPRNSKHAKFIFLGWARKINRAKISTFTAGLHTNFFSWWPDRATKIINYQFLAARTGNLVAPPKKVWNEWRQHSAPYDAKNKCRVSEMN